MHGLRAHRHRPRRRHLRRAHRRRHRPPHRLEILRTTRDDEDSYTISPVITGLQYQFEQLLNGGAPALD
jgi:hypothetical protein